ncbi:MAG TPA: CinA family protein [Xanthobacteraceae bacterium]|nr:CinA family protein [Xanthobacteraceae bacterium]
MQELLPLAEKAGALLKERTQTIVVAESASGGLIAAALLAVPGASAYFVGGAVLYTRAAHALMIELTEEAVAGLRPATEAHTLAVARHARKRFGTTWCLAEHGAAGPSGNRYGDPPGHSAIALAGPAERTRLVETGRSDRAANMHIFARSALELLVEALGR